jgi:1-aminocyclopropane-1-carboxylate deaminase/D-cysteine desulfhydrase-like pyridoxal-dependent ACC family enzyme
MVAEWPPRFPLTDGPSPLQPLPGLAAALGRPAELWVKREDLLPLAFGGNKLRNLEYLVGAAIAEGADCLVTVGRRWSNHARLTAAAGARAGLDVHLVLSGPPGAASSSPNVELCRLLGATVHVARTADRADRSALEDDVVAHLRAAGRRPYLIGIGGSGAIGALGQVAAARELAAQAAERGLVPDLVVVPSATGGTQAGLLAGLRGGGSTTRVVGVAVAQPADELRPAIANVLANLERYTGVTVDPALIELDTDQLGSGYGVRSRAADEATALIARSDGLLVDPIYTAKALAALVSLVRSGGLDGRRAVFWHAGGLPALFEALDEAPA